MKLNAPIIIENSSEIERVQEPVTVGIPIPKGVLTEACRLSLVEPIEKTIPLQATSLSTWSDNSIKWLLLDFQIDIKERQVKELLLQQTEEQSFFPEYGLTIQESETELVVDTGSVSFYIPTDIFRPFSQVIVDGQNFLATKKSATVLTGTDNDEYLPVISTWEWETRGLLRSTLKIAGEFVNGKQEEQLRFIARIFFFAGHPSCRIDFTLWNYGAATHPGGLWDLGDTGSFYFKDFSLHFVSDSGNDAKIYLKEDAEVNEECIKTAHLQIYQDSSGGNNWQSSNHVNCENKVNTTFRGYKVFSNQEEIKKGLRAEPTLIIDNGEQRIGAAIRCFWQNFPKALEAVNQAITIRFFPGQFKDVFELQGGERKTHTCLLTFQKSTEQKDISGWMHCPLEIRSTPQWYADSCAVPYLTPENRDADEQLLALIGSAIEGKNTFFDRREIIDEYGWRNFGDWYADHEAVGYKGSSPLISHYNNQYDGIYGVLCQYLKSGNIDWFTLGDQLCHHVRDIDIYHTDLDKPEYNKGLFWHTEHYLDAQTASHRCFSKRHAAYRDLSCYGGGPAMSHNYAWGLLYHYFLTGEEASREAVLDLLQFVQHQVISNTTLTHLGIEVLRKSRTAVKNLIKGRAIVDFDKVYSLNGPGRGAGNSLSTLLTAYELSGESNFLHVAENIISICIHPCDNLKKMDMLDVENRWMYTVFLQALGKYLDLTEEDNNANLWDYARDSLLLYGRWMVENEYLYLEEPEKLEYPNETWAAQEIRKSNVLLLAAKYCNDSKMQDTFIEKAYFFWQGCLNQLQAHDTHKLTRPITILLQNSLIPTFFLNAPGNTMMPYDLREEKRKKYLWSPLGCSRLMRIFYHTVRMFSLRNEVEFIRWRVK